MSAWTLTSNGTTLMNLPKIAVVRSFLLNHWYHHRGQLVVYLRLLTWLCRRSTAPAPTKTHLLSQPRGPPPDGGGKSSRARYFFGR